VRRRWWALASACVVVFGGGCSLFFPAPLPADEAFAIVAVDGDGSARPLAGAVVDDAQGVAADHRVERRLRVTWSGTTAPTEARYVVDGGEVVAELESAEDGVAYVTVPATLPVGRVVLLTLVAGAASAQAQVFFLQGEPGPPGPPGPKTLVVQGAACPFGGSRTLLGVDDDGDDVLDDDEIDVEHADCDAVVTNERLVAVPGDEALREVLKQLAGLRIVAPGRVTLSLPPGVVPMLGPLTVDHVDGERICLRGADPALGEATTLSFPDDGDGLIVTGGLRLERLTIDSPSPAETLVHEGVGLAVRDGGFIVVGGDDGAVVVSGFRVGISAHGGGVLTVDLQRDTAGNVVRVLQVVDAVIGLQAESGGTLEVPGALARGCSNVGFLATGGSIVASDSGAEDAGDVGYLAQFGGFVEASRSTATVAGSGSAAFFGTNGGALSCSAATGTILDPVTTARALVAVNGASVVCVGASLNGKVMVANGATAVTNDTIGHDLTKTADTNGTLVHVCSAPANAACRVACIPTNGGVCVGP